jgi:hypothetical protein
METAGGEGSKVEWNAVEAGGTIVFVTGCSLRGIPGEPEDRREATNQGKVKDTASAAVEGYSAE